MNCFGKQCRFLPKKQTKAVFFTLERYILDDIPEQADIVEKAINERESLALPLTKHYNIERKETVESIFNFLNETNDKNEILRLALKTFSETNFDFVDCILYANSKQYDIFTFDRKLSKFTTA